MLYLYHVIIFEHIVNYYRKKPINKCSILKYTSILQVHNARTK
jgi:hypothetical protein